MFLALLGGLTASQTHAGAWTQKANAGQVIFTIGRDVPPQGGFSGDRNIDADKTLAQIYVEYGVSDSLTVGGTVFGQFPDTGVDTDGAAAVGVFARQRVWQSEGGDVASVQVGYSHPIESLVGQNFGVNNDDSVPELGVRALFGTGFFGGWGRAFVSTEAGYHWRGQGEPDELQFDATGGYAIDPCCMALFSVFSRVPLDEGSDTQLKLAPSFAYTFGTAAGEDGGAGGPTLQLGVSQDLLDSDEGFGVQASLWKPF